MGLRERVSDLLVDPEETNLTEGSIGKPLFYLSIPIVVTNLLQTAYNLADTFWVGQYSTDALAAISFAFPMVFLLISLGMGVSVAGSVLVAQNIGAGKPKQAEYAASQTISFAAITSIVLGAIGYFVVDDMIAFFGASPDVLPLAAAYMRIISLGLIFMFGFFMFLSLMRGAGDTVTPMIVMFGSVVLNIALDPFVIFGWWIFPELGIAGAAYATIASRALAFVVGLAIMFRGDRGIRINLHQMKPDLTFGRRIVDIGLPASIEGTGRAVSINLILIVVGMFPTTVVAAFGIGIRIFSVIFLPAVAVARGVETMTGQNIGAGKPDRAATAAGFAAKAMFGVLALAGIVGWLLAYPIVDVFTTDPEVVEIGARFLRFVAPTFGFIGIMRAYTGSLRGAGKTLTAAAIAIFTHALVRLPLAYVGAQFFGPDGIWFAFAASNTVAAVVSYAWFRRGTWRDVDLSEEDIGPGPGAPTDD